MRTSLICIVTLLATPVVSESKRNKRYNRIRTLNSRDPLIGNNPPQAPEGRLLQLQAPPKGPNGVQGQKVDPKSKKAGPKDDKKMDPKLKKLDKKKDPSEPKVPLQGGELGLPSGLFADGHSTASSAQAAAGKAASAAKVVGPLVVIGGLAGLAAYKFFGSKKNPADIETEGDAPGATEGDIPMATAVPVYKGEEKA